MARRQIDLPPTLVPIGLSRIEASAFIGVSASLFDEMVKDGRMPKPKAINSRTVWDRRAIERAFDLLPGGSDDGGGEWDVET
ncbi:MULTISPECIES: hypothetical protein [unclassified Mesorhizobium]|uniref:helix-turn-helix transcriptional regulator n=1 Tax=unclassified Mesorhizobium TaxID=325217 RepID=UPI000FCCA7F8|nr:MULTISPECIES: hypothetical protein [unclassified Mesorhizobium]TGP22357.1 hypothetical protein EN874_019810 [Mesorhizobium sp. M1D.F.Ca.ET.231.01.1.1]TGP24673.1 hypothetical protein EN877_30385 [Mesorhizobium sp. M1D.F.Ca.ET.234.01.1.1]TGS37276.1 hypothetical protein EN827_30690 [Mesorhizobium sp. M1D.F.Ca.ET.184.01.1.1]TGS58076.1 hypothetical protein EN826_030665 [Mesorhizobium sp. M1D.F.Ca.ET.183.01.1.1]